MRQRFFGILWLTLFACGFSCFCEGRRRQLSSSKVLLEDGHERAVSDLANRQHKREKRREALQKSGRLPQTWMDGHMNFARGLKYRWGEPVSQALKENPWFQTLTEREQDVLRLAQVQSPHVLFRDVSQSVVRANVGTWDDSAGRHILPTVLPKMLLWCESKQRVWLGCEALMCQGFPVLPLLKTHEATMRPQAWQPSETLMQDLAGNAMAIPVVLAILQSLFAAFSWQPNPNPNESSPLERLEPEDFRTAVRDEELHVVMLS